MLYSVYAVNQETCGKLVSGVDSYGIPLVDMFTLVYDQMQDGYVTLNDDMTQKIKGRHSQLC